jgi:hypothetical protein
MDKKTKSEKVKDTCFPLGNGWAGSWDIKKILALNTEMMERIEELERQVKVLAEKLENHGL